MKKLHFELLKVLTFAFITLFFSHAQAKDFNETIKLPDFKGRKAIWIIRAGVGFNGFTGSNH